VVGQPVPGPVQADERLLHHVLGRLPGPQHDEREPGQAEGVAAVQRGHRVTGVGLAVIPGAPRHGRVRIILSSADEVARVRHIAFHVSERRRMPKVACTYTENPIARS
jgi:hypothetical protein